MLIAPLTAIVVVAFSVRLNADPHATGSTTLIVPASSRPDAVSTVTLLAASCSCKVAGVTFDGVVSRSVKTPAVLTRVPESVPLAIVKLVGSSSRLPTAPRGAVRSTNPSYSRFCLPETSALPPLPPCAPPRALALP